VLQWALERTMQLHLEPDELNLLANILMQKSGKPYEGLLDMVLARDTRFDADDLDTVADLLAAEKRSLKDNISREPDGVRKGTMLAALVLLEKVQERVNEACVMF
jgi:hypothetical protein